MATRGTYWSRRAVGALLYSLKLTLREAALAMRARDPARIGALFREGSPLEESIRGVLYYAFVALLLAPVVILPAYYLFLALAG
jgi:hypothetical protein